MSSERTNFLIESLKLINSTSLSAEFFINPTIALMESYQRTPFPVDVQCERISSYLIDNYKRISIEISWEAGTFPNSGRLLNTVQREVIVEYAAIAVAFLLVTNIANCTISEVALRGDKADYFVNDRKYMLEVSGTENPKQAAPRHKNKVEQLLANPYEKGGYVVVCCFSNQKAYFSFHASPFEKAV